MLSSISRHPFPVVANFRRVVAVSFAFPETTLRTLVPAGLDIDSYEGLGFVTVAMVWTEDLRPAGIPAWLGQDFFLAGYRIFTQLLDHDGRRLRGLRILRSETNKRLMTWMGNLLTGYRYRYVRVAFEQIGKDTRVLTTLPDDTPTADITFGPPSESVALPKGSPFPDWTAARRFAGPMPFTFSPENDGSFVVIEGSRQNWVPQPVPVHAWKIGIFDETPLAGGEPILANAFTVENVPYRWKAGRIVRPGGSPV